MTSHNKKTGFWKVQHADGDIEEFNVDDVVNYVVRGEMEPTQPASKKVHGHTVTSPAAQRQEMEADRAQDPADKPPSAPVSAVKEKGESRKSAMKKGESKEPRPVLFAKEPPGRRAMKKGDRVSTKATTFDGETKPGEPRFSDQHPERCHGSVLRISKKGLVKVHWDDDEIMQVPRNLLQIEEPPEDEQGTSTAKRAKQEVLKFNTNNTRRFQHVPSRTEKGGKQLSGDVRDYERRVTLDLDSQDIIEDASTEELAKWGYTEKLPVNVRNIRTFYYYAPKMGAKGARNLTHLSVKGDTMNTVLKQLGVRQEFAKMYAKYVGNEWLESRMDQERKVQGFNAHKRPFKTGTLFPRPHDAKWRDMTKAYRVRQAKLHPPWKTAKLIAEAMEQEVITMKLRQNLGIKREERHAFYARRALATVHFQQRIKRDRKFRSLDAVGKLTQMQARAAKVMEAVATVWDALGGEHAKAWVDVLLQEDAKLDTLEVFLHDVPKEVLRAVGITEQFIVPSRCVPTVKTLPTGEFDRPKTRKIIQGHKYAMQKNVHYDKTFTATPSLDSSRYMEAKGVGHALMRFTFDIVSAFQHAPHDGPPLGVRYPKGFEHWCDKTGAELFAVLSTVIKLEWEARRRKGIWKVSR